MIVCESDRLIIRQLTLADAEFMLRLLNEESFIRNISDKKVHNITQAKSIYKNEPWQAMKNWASVCAWLS